MKLADDEHRAQLLAIFLMDTPLEFTLVDILELQAVLKKLNKSFVANLKWQDQWTIDFFFKSI